MSKLPIEDHTRRRTRSLTKADRSCSIEIHSIPSERPTPNTKTTSKRKSAQLAANSPASPESNNAKKQATEMAVTFDAIQKLFEQHNATIIDTIKSTVHSELNAFSEQLKTDINNKITELNSKIDDVKANFSGQSEQLATIQSTVNNCIERININEDDCIRIAKLNELKIRGVPHKDGENLQAIFSAIAEQVGFDVAQPNNVPELNRVRISSNRDNISPAPPTIFVKFVAQHIRDNFYSLYINSVKAKPLKTEHIGMEQGGRIYFGEVLTPKNQRLFINAMKMKKENKLAKVYTKNGLVMVKKSADSRPTTIRTLRELDVFIESVRSSSVIAPSAVQTDQSAQQNLNTTSTAEALASANNSSTQMEITK